jgi:Zn-dependent alcohol dehydrogenase
MSFLLLDVSGIVEAVGSDVTIFKKGDRVLGFADGFSSGKLDNSAFQTYTIVPVTSAAKIPDSIDFEHGAMLPMAIATSSIALFNDLDLPRPTFEPAPRGSASILIWGGASGLGSMAIQLAYLAGYTVYAVASQAQHTYLKSLGATALFDYRSSTVVKDIIDAAKSAGQPISHALDVISEEKTLTAVGEVLSRSGGQGSKLAHVLPWPESIVKPDGVQLLSVSGENMWTTREDISTWLFHSFLPSALEKGVIVPSPQLKIVDGGLSGLQSAMDSIKKGVSGQKLVVKLS